MAWHDAPYAKRVAIYATAQQQRARPESAHSGRAFYRSNRQRKPWLPQAERKKECNLPVWVELVAKPAEPESLRRIPFQTNRPVRGIPSNRHQYLIESPSPLVQQNRYTALQSCVPAIGSEKDDLVNRELSVLVEDMEAIEVHEDFDFLAGPRLTSRVYACLVGPVSAHQVQIDLASHRL